MQTNNKREKQDGKRRHYHDGFDFLLRKSREPELRRWLKKHGMTVGKDYVLTWPKLLTMQEMWWLPAGTDLDRPQTVTLSIRDKSLATLFKLSWSECDDDKADFPKIILPLIRKVMPNVLANQIIGVQPMTGPVAQIRAMRANYATGASSPSPSASLPSIRPDDDKSQ